jgi:hypothetical protein
VFDLGVHPDDVPIEAERAALLHGVFPVERGTEGHDGVDVARFEIGVHVEKGLGSPHHPAELQIRTVRVDAAADAQRGISKERLVHAARRAAADEGRAAKPIDVLRERGRQRPVDDEVVQHIALAEVHLHGQTEDCTRFATRWCCELLKNGYTVRL